MKVSLVSFTPDAQRVVASAARVCYSESSASELFSSIGEEKIKKRIRDAVSKGHLSVLEHAVYTFSIESISRVTSHQLVRHRIASFSQQSQRYVGLSDRDSYIVPPRIAEDEKLCGRFREIVSGICDFYETLVRTGIPSEDARYILPSAFSTNLVLTMNARELLHFFSLRCCKKAQWEIRKLAWKMLKELMKISPAIFENAGPECISGSCSQEDWKCFEKMKRLYDGGKKI